MSPNGSPQFLTFNFSTPEPKLICHFDFLSLELKLHKRQPLLYAYAYVMDLNLGQCKSIKSKFNEQIPMRETNNALQVKRVNGV